MSLLANRYPHRNSGLPEFRTTCARKSGKPDLRCRDMRYGFGQLSQIQRARLASLTSPAASAMIIVVA